MNLKLMRLKSGEDIVVDAAKKKDRSLTVNKVCCTECGKYMWKKNLETHKRNIHLKNNKGISERRYHRGSCIHPENGIFLISGQLSGVQHPIHVQKCLVPGKKPAMFCEFKGCAYLKAVSSMSGQSSFECDHLLSTQFLKCSEPVTLDPAALDHLVSTMRISESTKNYCLQQKYVANSWGNVLVNAMGGMGMVSERFIFLSVWTGEIHDYSRLSRVVLSFDKEIFDLVC